MTLGVFLFVGVPLLLLCGFLVAAIAEKKGRSFVGWFVLGALIGPLALVAIAVASKDPEGLAVADAAQGTHRRCPYCAEMIRAEAIKCRFCGSDVEPAAATAQPQSAVDS